MEITAGIAVTAGFTVVIIIIAVTLVKLRAITELYS